MKKRRKENTVLNLKPFLFLVAKHSTVKQIFHEYHYYILFFFLSMCYLTNFHPLSQLHFFGHQPWHVEVPGPGIKPTPEQQPKLLQ